MRAKNKVVQRVMMMAVLTIGLFFVGASQASAQADFLSNIVGTKWKITYDGKSNYAEWTFRQKIIAITSATGRSSELGWTVAGRNEIQVQGGSNSPGLFLEFASPDTFTGTDPNGKPFVGNRVRTAPSATTTTRQDFLSDIVGTKWKITNGAEWTFRQNIIAITSSSGQSSELGWTVAGRNEIQVRGGSNSPALFLEFASPDAFTGTDPNGKPFVGNRIQAVRDEEDREIRRVTAQGVSNPSAIADGNNTTRATTNTPNYAGRSVLVDLGGIFTVSRVIQIHDPDPKDFPGRYKIEVTEVTDGSAWHEVGKFEGRNGRSDATFAPVRARLLRITATANHDPEHWWSIYRLRVRG